jgi:hypothetical protein
MSKRERFRELIQKYKPEGIIKGSSFLLSPSAMLPLVDELEAANILILGAEAWRYTTTLINGSIGIYEDLEFDFDTESEKSNDDNPVKASAFLVKEHIKQLPPEIELVSLTLELRGPDLWS